MSEMLQVITSEGLSQVPYVVARVGFKPVTFWTHGTEPTLLLTLLCLHVGGASKMVSGHRHISEKSHLKKYCTNV